MKNLILLTTLGAMVALPTAGFAGNGNGKGKNKGGFEVQRVAPQGSFAAAGHCPPGLAKKSVPCVPPGQAKKYYRVGDRINGGFRAINDPYRYGLRRDGYYVRAGDYVYRIDPDTHKVLNLIGAVADILY